MFENGMQRTAVEMNPLDLTRLPEWARRLNEVAEATRRAAFYWRTRYVCSKKAMHDVLGTDPENFARFDAIMKRCAEYEREETDLCKPELKRIAADFRALLVDKCYSKGGKEVIKMGKCCGGKKGCKGKCCGGKKGCKGKCCGGKKGCKGKCCGGKGK